MKYKAMYSFLILSLVGCAHTERIDENYTKTDPSFQKSFSKAKKQCLDATEATLKDMGAGIDSKNEDEIISQRYNAFAYAVGNANMAQLQQEQIKLYFKVSGEGKNCLVKLTKVRAWNNGSEYEKIALDFTKKNVVSPVFSDLTERLSR